MGFCRRCGDIVVGPRCKCGGTSVAPVVKWGQDDGQPPQDRWSRTYVSREKSSTRQSGHTPSSSVNALSSSSSSPTKRFPRPNSAAQPTPTVLGSRVSAHIASATASRPPSPLKHSRLLGGDDSPSLSANAAAGILPSPDGLELSKVYGSILQAKENLASYQCAICCTPFPPDATIYPDPSSLSPRGEESGPISRFLCRPCFITNGGSKGECPTCNRPVLILKSEGGFVETSGKVWHKKCFNCSGCFKYIGDDPMVDLLGKPSCADCFDSCLTRSADSPQRRGKSMDDDKRSNLGGTKRSDNGREGSPALDELEQRLGIVRSRESTPIAEEKVGRLSADARSPFSTPNTRSSLAMRSSNSNIKGMDASPIAERVAARARANSSAGLHTPPLSSILDYGSSSGRALSRLKSPELDTASDDGSPRRAYRLTSPDPEQPRSDGSPVPRRTYTRFKTPEPDGSGSPYSRTNSPRYGSPASTKPTEEAIEEMKKRFLRQASPAPSGADTSISSITSTPTGRSTYSSRSSYSALDSAQDAFGSTPPRRDRTSMSRIPRTSSNPGLRNRASTSSLNTSLTRDITGTTIPRDITGNTVARDLTGNTMARDLTGHTMARDLTGNTMAPNITGGTIASMLTGGTIARVGRDMTDHTVARDITGTASVLRDLTGATDYTLRRDRTGDAEVESLLGAQPGVVHGDLIDLESPDNSMSSSTPSRAGSTGPMSKIPVSSRGAAASSRLSRTGLGLRTSMSSSSLKGDYMRGDYLAGDYQPPSVPNTPDLAGDFSDTTSTTPSSAPPTPPSVSPPTRHSPEDTRGEKRRAGRSSHGGSHAGRRYSKEPMPKAKAAIPSPTPMASDARCAKCSQPLFNTKHGGKFVTVPEEPSSSGVPPKTYHTACFKCRVCGGLFEERDGGRAVFVRGQDGACHVECMPADKVKTRQVISHLPKPSMASSVHSASSIPTPKPTLTTRSTYAVPSSSRYERPPTTAPPTTTSFTFPAPRFGGSQSCPGCGKAVAVMERGVVPGPGGSRWHGACLVCGGKDAKSRRREQGKAGCGKKLDSAAKSDGDGGVWCRECLLLLPAPMRETPSPTRPLAAASTGTTTIARQFTGATADAGILRQLTGGGLSPTRQLTSSPTKMFDGPRPGAGRFPRPRSVIGVRSTKSDGEGRGMFLVRQLTGGNSSSGGQDYGL